MYATLIFQTPAQAMSFLCELKHANSAEFVLRKISYLLSKTKNSHFEKIIRKQELFS